MTSRWLILLALGAFLVSNPGCAVPPPDGGDNGQDGGDDGDGGDLGDLGDLVGSITASVFRSISSGQDLSSVSAGASFFETGDGGNGSVSDTQTFGDCVVTTTQLADVEVPDFTPLDAGDSGTVDNGTTDATLTSASTGAYSGPADLAVQGFGAGQTFAFAFPGGDDVEDFTASVEVPGALTVTTPDLTAEGFTIDRSAALPFQWSAAGTAEDVTIVVSSSSATTFVSITCNFEDSGAATIPQGAMNLLLENPTSTTVSVTLMNTEAVGVGLVGGGSGSVQVIGQTGISRTILPGFDDGGFDLCQFVQCPEGQTCDPQTLLCE